jgi:hypothetical protein
MTTLTNLFDLPNQEYLWIYLAIGVIATIRPVMSYAKDYYERANSELIRGFYGERPLKEKVFMPFVIAFSGLVFIVFWPITGLFYLKHYFSGKN